MKLSIAVAGYVTSLVLSACTIPSVDDLNLDVCLRDCGDDFAICAESVLVYQRECAYGDVHCWYEGAERTLMCIVSWSDCATVCVEMMKEDLGG